MQVIGDEIRQAAADIAEDDAGFVAGQHGAGGGAGLAGKQIFHALAGRAQAAGGFKGRALNAPLEGHARQRMIAAEILRANAHQHGGIGIAPVAGMMAHAVHVHAARLAGSVDHLSAGAHAEGVHAALIRRGHIELVLRRRQGGMSRVAPVLRTVDLLLQMLDAHAHGKRLLLHGQTQVKQPFISIPRAMADGEVYVAGFDFIRLPVPDHLGGNHAAILQTKPCEPAPEARLPAQPDQLPAGVDKHLAQLIRADVRLLGLQNFLRRAAAVQGLEHRANMRAVDATGELAIRKSARPALAEEHVAVRIENAAAFQQINILCALLHGLAAIHQQRLSAAHRQRQRAEQPRRARAHHHGAFAAFRPRGQVQRKYIRRILHLPRGQITHLIGLELLSNPLLTSRIG